jgi:hypothetical protein
MSILARTPARCAGAFNFFVIAFCVRLPLVLAASELHRFDDFDLVFALGLAALLVYVAFQAGWPILLLPPLAFGLMQPFYAAFIAIPLMLLVLVQARLFLQRNGYDVGLVGARPALVESGASPISFGRKIGFVAAVGSAAWFPFLLVWAINPAYNAKFFQPMAGIEPWLGPVLLGFAVLLTAFLYPLGAEFFRLRSRVLTWTTGTQLTLTVLLVLAALLAIASLLLLTPAAMTMMQQMRTAPSLPVPQ